MNSHRNLLSFSDQKSFLKLSESTVTMTSIKLKKKRHLLSPDPIKSEISRTNGGRKTEKGYRNRNRLKFSSCINGRRKILNIRKGTMQLFFHCSKLFIRKKITKRS